MQLLLFTTIPRSRGTSMLMYMATMGKLSQKSWMIYGNAILQAGGSRIG